MTKKKFMYPEPEVDEIPMMVEEPMALFGTVRSRQEIIGEIKRGLPVQSFDTLRQEFGVAIPQLAKTLNINPRTLTRRRESGRFNTDESERVYRLGRLFKIALNLFKEEGAVRQWFATPKEIFGGETPLNYADTEPGAQEVEKQLRRIAHGVFC
jgi:putative toxin-antitoxin system antitoxin component (TIGR02293 family)